MVKDPLKTINRSFVSGSTAAVQDAEASPDHRQPLQQRRLGVVQFKEIDVKTTGLILSSAAPVQQLGTAAEDQQRQGTLPVATTSSQDGRGKDPS
jgi:hypothetical protein